MRAGANVDSLLTVLVGNKADYRDGSADSRAEVVKEDAQRCAKELNAKYFEVSAVCASLYPPFLSFALKTCHRRLQIQTSRNPSPTSLANSIRGTINRK